MTLHDAWETQAENWTRWAREPNFDSYWVFHRELFLALLPPPGRLTLDVGCGEGRVTRDLRALGHRVVGVDAALSLVAAARDEDSGGEYLVAHAAELPFAVPRRGKTAARGYDAAWRRLASTSNPCSAVVLGVWQRY